LKTTGFTGITTFLHIHLISPPHIRRPSGFGGFFRESSGAVFAIDLDRPSF